MGLDMYLYRVSKINADKRRVYTREELEGNSWNDYSPEDIKSFPKSIVDNCIELKVKIEYYNINKILAENGQKEGTKIGVSCYSSKGITFSIYPEEKETIQVEISNEDLPKYLFSQINKRCVCKMEEVDYQRKGLNDEGWALLPGNCEYCDDKSRIKEMCEIGGLSETFLENWVDNETVFYPWW